MVKIGAKAAETSADAEDIRVISAVTSHVAQQANPTGKESASNVPKKVAMPFPPLNFRKIG